MKFIIKIIASLFIFLIAFSTSYGQDIPVVSKTTMNIIIGSFTFDGSYDYSGNIALNESSGYTTDSLKKGDFIRDAFQQRYKIDSIITVIPNSISKVWLTCLQPTCIPPSIGVGAAFERSMTGIEFIPQNGSSYITEAQEASMLNHNFALLDSTINAVGSGSSFFDSDRPILREPTVGTNIGASTVVDWLEWWYFTAPTLTLNNPSSNLFEIGDSVLVTFSGFVSNPSSTTLSNNDFKVINPIDSILTNGFGLSFTKTIGYSPKQTPVNAFDENSYQFRMEADYTGVESGSVTSATRTINAVYPIFYGVDSTDFTVTGDPYTELTKSVTSEGNKSLTLNGDGFIYFLIPKTWSDFNLSSIIDHNGFNVTASFTATDINITSTGLTNNYTNVAYKMYKLNNITSTNNFTYQINR